MRAAVGIAQAGASGSGPGELIGKEKCVPDIVRTQARCPGEQRAVFSPLRRGMRPGERTAERP